MESAYAPLAQATTISYGVAQPSAGAVVVVAVAPRPVVRTPAPLARLAARLRSLHLAVAAALVAWCRTLVVSLLPARAEVEHRPAAA